MLDNSGQGAGDGQKKIIMVVDDSTITLLTVSNVLGKEFDVRLCNGSKSAFLMLRRYKPDLILLDIEMPEMDGFEFMEKFREKYPDDDIPVIFVTSHKSGDAVAMAVKAGAKDYVGKPFSPDILRAKVIGALK
ncbi:MAG: response regulator [Synergistaceae bacterium]|jgi:putative two-component system response regulator|nr:response regulator [Synergistaceae bacterium]